MGGNGGLGAEDAPYPGHGCNKLQVGKRKTLRHAHRYIYS